MAKQQLTEPQAWRHLAEVFDYGGYDSGFLCDWIRHAPQMTGVSREDCHWWDADVTPVGKCMLDRIQSHLGRKFSAYSHPVLYDDTGEDECDVEQNKEPRVLACLWLAMEAEEDAK